MDFIDYREKLGLGFNDKELENLFFIRLFNILDDYNLIENQVSRIEYCNFCNATGCPILHDDYREDYWITVKSILHKNSTSIKNFLPFYMFFINTQEDNDSKFLKKEDFKLYICNCLDDTHIPYDVLEDNGRYFIFPKGVEELDKALVSENLIWLKDYPETQKAWISALKHYSESTELTASETADNFRKALETFFQEFFNSDKTLENLKSEYGNFLNEREIPPEITNTFEKLLDLYTKYMNNYAKHHDEVSKNVLEYIMYQTGNLIRLLITLK